MADFRVLTAFCASGRLLVLGAALLAGVVSGCGRSSSSTGTGGSAGDTGTGGSSVGGGTGGSTTGSGGIGSGGTSGKGSGGASGNGTGGSAGGLGEAGTAGIPESCVPGSPPRVPMRQLTRFQYDNVARDVLGIESAPSLGLSQNDLGTDLAVDGVFSSTWVSELHDVAHDVATASTAGAALSATLGCDLDADGEAACQARLFEHVLPLLLRRPLDAEDLDEFEALLLSGREAGGDFASGVRMVLEVALQAPEFLYRTEVGEPLDVPSSDPRAGWSRPTSFEMASRLSFLLWGSAPDEALLTEAAAGGLRTREEVRAAAERLLGDERAAALIRYVHLRLLRLLDRPFPPDGHEAFTESIFLLMQSETAAFLDDVSSSGPGGFAQLLTAPYTFLNEELAAFYGIPDVTGPDLRKVPLESLPYSGVLTQGSFLARHSAATRTSPTYRGVAVLDAFLCNMLGSPPPSHIEVLPPVPAGSTTREVVEAATGSHPACAGCHRVIDPPGFALEHFDPIGRYRATEAGAPIDATAEITIGDETQRVDGAPGLGQLLADSPEAHACYVTHWAAYAYATTMESPLDDCSRAQLADAFERSNGDLRALLLELTQTDAFLYLPPGEP